MATCFTTNKPIFQLSTDEIQVGQHHKSDLAEAVYYGDAQATLNAKNPPLKPESKRLADLDSLPDGAVDTHVHVFDPRLGPYAATRSYTPGDAPLDELIAFSSNLSASETPASLVLVQASPYRTDNTVLLSTLRNCHAQGLPFTRGIAVVDLQTVTQNELQHMHELGVRGLRLNLQADGQSVDTIALGSTLKTAAKKISHLPGWMLQVFAPAVIWQELYDVIINLPVVVIADHTAGLLAASKLPQNQQWCPLQQAGLEAVVRLAQQSRVLIKISGLYRSSNDLANNFGDMAPIVKHLAEQAPDSLLWASDWPHTGEGSQRSKAGGLSNVEPFRVIDNQGILANVRKWVGSQETWLKMMVYNPRRAYR